MPQQKKVGQKRVRTRVDHQGRVVIPAEFRRTLGIEPGDVVTLHIEDGELRLLTVAESLARAQALVMKHMGPGPSLVDELIAERREEARRE